MSPADDPIAKLMNSVSNNSWSHIHHIGETASNLLTSGSRGTVLASFSNVVYLNSSHNELIWLVTEKCCMHRRGIQLAGPLPRVVADSSFRVMDHHLIFGSDIVLEFSRASKWQTPHPLREDIKTFTDIPTCVRTFLSTIDDLPPPAGFGIFITEILKLAHNHPSRRPFPKLAPAQVFAWSAIQRIANACLAHDFPLILEHAEELIGLGEGLTPSGDDFIGGLLFCIMMLQYFYDPFDILEFSDIQPFLERTKQRTNIISYTMLRDHAAGHATETLHRLINTLLTGQSLKSTYRLGLELIRIGHSTGWDLLAGLLTGMLLAFNFGALSTIRSCSSDSYRNQGRKAEFYGYQTEDRESQ